MQLQTTSQEPDGRPVVAPIFHFAFGALTVLRTRNSRRGEQSMKRSTNRFLTTHMGSLARPDGLSAMLTAKDAGEPYDADALAKRVASAVAEVVKQQADNGIDIVNDGEFSKFS